MAKPMPSTGPEPRPALVPITRKTSRERILCFGTAGSGKSAGFYATARWFQAVQPDVHFYVLDTDMAAERALSEEFADLDNVTAYLCTSWQDLLQATEQVIAAAKPGDWLAVDMIDKAWSYVQAHFVEEVHDKGFDQYLLDARKAMEKTNKDGGLQPFEGWKDWPAINAMYKAWVERALYNNGGLNVYGCAPVKDITRDTDKETKEVFGVLGICPAGQKDLSHQFHTVLLCTRTKGGEWTLTSVKDRGRPLLDKARCLTFPITYLIQTAGFGPDGRKPEKPRPEPAATSAS